MQVSNFSSNLFLTAAAQNLLCLDLAAQAGIKLASPWLDWFIAAAPPCIVGILLTPLIMYKVCAKQSEHECLLVCCLAAAVAAACTSMDSRLLLLQAGA